MHVLDPSLRPICYEGDVLKSLQIALICIQDDMRDRPSMSNVVMWLDMSLVYEYIPNKIRGEPAVQGGWSPPPTPTTHTIFNHE